MEEKILLSFCKPTILQTDTKLSQSVVKSYLSEPRAVCKVETTPMLQCRLSDSDTCTRCSCGSRFGSCYPCMHALGSQSSPWILPRAQQLTDIKGSGYAIAHSPASVGYLKGLACMSVCSSHLITLMISQGSHQSQLYFLSSHQQSHKCKIERHILLCIFFLDLVFTVPLLLLKPICVCG